VGGIEGVYVFLRERGEVHMREREKSGRGMNDRERGRLCVRERGQWGWGGNV